MSKIEELLMLADEAIAWDVCDDPGCTCREVLSDFSKDFTPQVAKQLLELVKMQHEALLVHIALTRPIDTSSKALEAFDIFDKGTGK